MVKRNLVIACDHAGYDLKEYLKQEFASVLQIEDLGCTGSSSVDYPDYADRLASFMANNQDYVGILICGTGIGISIAANRHKHIRAALCCNKKAAELTRMHNDANVLALGSRMIGKEEALDIAEVFLSTEYEAGRHSSRVKKLG